MSIAAILLRAEIAQCQQVNLTLGFVPLHFEPSVTFLWNEIFPYSETSRIIRLILQTIPPWN